MAHRFAVGAMLAGSFDLGQGLLSLIFSGIGGEVIGYAIGQLGVLALAARSTHHHKALK